MITRTKVWIFLVSIFISATALAQTNAVSESDLKKKADKSYSAGEYDAAMPLYSQLLSLYPKDASYNYRYGVCVMQAGKEKVNAVSFLEFASTQPNIDADVWYYLGKGYMLAANFQGAQKSFEKFRQTGSSAKVKKLETDLLISNCSNAEELMKSRRNVAVIDAKEVSRTNFYAAFDFSDANGKMLPTAEKFLTGTDKDLQIYPTMFLSKDGQILYYSSYGKNSLGGKDIYLRRKMTNGDWAEAENLGSTVNTAENEDYPVLDKDGRTLYFSSRGHNSIGGYDLYKTQFDLNTGKWSTPQNLGIPINTVDDDFLYLPTLKGEKATYATELDAPSGKIIIRTIDVGDVSNDLVSISGTYFSLDQVTRRDARVTVLRTSDHGIITSVRTDPRTGRYDLVLEPGMEYTLVVEGGSYLPHAENFTLPVMSGASLRQEVKLNKTKEKEEMTLVNFFTPLAASGNQALAASDVPTETISKSYDLSRKDSSDLIPVKIENDVVYVAAPTSKSAAPGDQTSVSSTNQTQENVTSRQSNADNSTITQPEDTTENLADAGKNKKEKYDPYLEKPLTADELKQKEDEETRTKEVVLEEKGKIQEVDVNVSNDELAKMAFDDARSIETESIALKNEAASLRSQAVSKDSLSGVLKLESDQMKVKDPDKSQALLTQSEESHSEAEQLAHQASLLEEQSSQKATEAKLALEDAKQIVLAASEKKSLAASGSPKKGSVKSNTTGGNQTAENVKPVSGGEVTPSQDSNASGPTNAKNAASDESQNSPSKSNDANLAVNQNSNQDSKNELNQNLPKTESTEVADGKVNAGNSNPVGENSQRAANSNLNDENKTVSKEQNTGSSVSDNPAQKRNEDKSVQSNSDQSVESSNPALAAKEKTSDQRGKSNVQTSEQPTPNAQPASANKSEPVNQNELAAIEKKSDAEKNIDASPLNDNKTGEEKNQVENSKTTSGDNSNKTAINTEQIASSTKKNNSEISGTAAQEKESAPGINESEIKNSEAPAQSAQEIESARKSDGQNSGEQENLALNNSAEPLKTSSVPVRTNSTFSGTLTEAGVNMIPNLKQEALTAYKGYEDNIVQSKKLAAQSEKLQIRVAGMKISPMRDSLIVVSNDLSHESIKNWQEAQKQLKEAKQIDPDVDQKVQEYKSSPAYTLNTNSNLASNTNPVSTQASKNSHSASSGTEKANTISGSDVNKENKESAVQDNNTAQNAESKSSVPAAQQNGGISSSPLSQESKDQAQNDGVVSGNVPQQTIDRNNTNKSGGNLTENTSPAPKNSDVTKGAEIKSQPTENTSTASDNTTSVKNENLNSENVGNSSVQSSQANGQNPATNSNVNPSKSSTTENLASTKSKTGDESAAQPLAENSTSIKTNDENVSSANPSAIKSEETNRQNPVVTNETNKSEIQPANGNNKIELNPSNNGLSQANTEKNDGSKKVESGNSGSGKANAVPSNSGNEDQSKPGLANNSTPVKENVSTSQQGSSATSPAGEKTSTPATVNPDVNSNPAKIQSSGNENLTANSKKENSSGNINDNPEIKSQPLPEQLDTTKEEYPRYIKIQKDINAAQVETINIFASAINLNKIAVEQKQKQLDLLDEADRTPDPDKKNKLLKEAEKLRKSSLKNEADSKIKFTEAQQKTSEVKVLTWQMESVKSKLVLPSAQPDQSASKQDSQTSPVAVNTNPSVQSIPTTEAPAQSQPTTSVASKEAESNPFVAASQPAVLLSAEEKETMAVSVFSKSPEPVYSDTKPIPINPALPEGLVFKVQVGAFHKPIPNETFKNLQPVSGENTRPGWIRYCVGMFKTFEPANVVKKDLRKNGFKDAFVVAYFNGNRISLGEAYAILNKPGNDLRGVYAQENSREMAMLNDMNIHDDHSGTPVRDEDARQFYGADFNKYARLTEGTGASEDNVNNAGTVADASIPGGIVYAVQVGVYRTSTPPALLTSLQPLYTEPINKGLFRYTNGRYSFYSEADSAKRIAVNTGVKDAFIIVFKNGRRISLAGLGASTNAKSNSEPVSVNSTGSKTAETSPAVEPKSAGSAETEGIVFRVQLGAFKNNVPYQMVEAFLKITDKGISQETDKRGLHIFYTGSFTDYTKAMQLKEEIVNLGVKDAFVVALRNGERIPISEAFKALRN